MASLGIRLRHFRKRRGMTQQELADAAGLTPKFISQIENDHVNPTVNTVERLVVRGLHVSLPVFFVWETDGIGLSEMLEGLERQPSDSARRIVRMVRALCETVHEERPGRTAPRSRGKTRC